jgi:hypothetical protein
MKTKLHFLIITVLICSTLIACGSAQTVKDVSPTQDTASIAEAQATKAPIATSTLEPSATCTSTPTETLAPSATPNLTATAVAATSEARAATQQAKKTAEALAEQATQQAVDAVWTQLVDDETITYNMGDQYTMDDLDESWAQRNWYQWYSFGLNMSDFVVMSHIDWETAEASYGNGGCGFVIRLKDNNNHLVVFLTPKGDAELGAMTFSGYQPQSTHWKNPDLPAYSAITPPTSGSNDFMIVAEKEFVTAYVDGVKIYQWYVALTKPGDMGYTILSGTNKDFGTSCKFTNTQVWELTD